MEEMNQVELLEKYIKKSERLEILRLLEQVKTLEELEVVKEKIKTLVEND